MSTLSNLVNIPLKTIPLTAISDTALCVGAGGSSGSLADKPIIRNGEGYLLIPASQLKGRLRHECEKLARGLHWPVCQSPKAETMCPQLARLENQIDFHIPEYELVNRHHCLICQIFGNPSLPSRLICEDLICKKSPEELPKEVLRPGVTINRRRQVAEDKKLYILETSPMNITLEFEGSITLLPSKNFTQPLHPDYSKALIFAALKHINALGGSKSTGLGWLHWKDDTATPAINSQAWQDLGKGKRKS